MHIAVALNRPIVALFGDSNPRQWRPWGVPHIVVQEETNNVHDIEVSSIVDAWAIISKSKINTLNKKPNIK
jgi:ADP-heptose:LPS heptosyltransferase